ncbi:MAG: (d)CMP kinase [Actinomycetota bacterium]
MPALSSPLIVAVDGPSGSGKSSVSREVARRFGAEYLDTGAMYRALTWWCLNHQIDPADQDAVVTELNRIVIVMGMDPQDPHVRVHAVDKTQKVDVTIAIREPVISKNVSLVATNLTVRNRMREWQRTLIREHSDGIVVEGRDITTVIAPEAPVRVLLTADEHERLARRTRELHGSVTAITVEATRDQVVRRDTDDATVASFTEPADGVVVIDSSMMAWSAVVDALVDVICRLTTHRPRFL